MTAPRVITEDLGGSALARAARAGTLPSEWFSRPPVDAEGWRTHAREVAATAPRGWLDTLAPAIDASDRSADRLTRAANGGVVITTGQQPGLFGGPLYTLAKAMSALALANEIERSTGVPAAPLFWAATDDADFEEARGTTIAIDGGVEVLRLVDAPPAGTPMSAAPIGDVAALLGKLEAACGSTVDPDVLALVRASYSSGATVGSAYVALLRALLSPLGVAVLDASHAAVRRAGAPTLRCALERAADVDEALRRRATELEARGFHPQVDYTAGLSLVFAHDPEKRRIPVHAAAEALRATPVERLSPNVLLRPIVERSILPTVTYVAGPGEIAYFSQLSAAADAMGALRPLAVPRWSGTILEPHVTRILERLGIDRDDLRRPNEVETRLARLALPPELADTLRAFRRDVERDSEALAATDDRRLVPPESLQGVRRAMLHRLERLERRYVAGVKRREVQLMRDVATARASLHPGGTRQERVLGFAAFLARHGRALMTLMLEQASVHAATLLGGERAMPAPATERVAQPG